MITSKNHLIKSLSILTLIVFASTSLLIAQGQTAPQEVEGKSLLEVVETHEKTEKFSEVLNASGFARVLKQAGSYTVIAPNNEAIDNVESKLKEQPKELMKGQLYQGEISEEDVENQLGVNIVDKDESAANGVVYVVDKVSTGR